MRFYRNDEIERIAERRLADLAAALGEPLSPPVPMDLFCEKVLGLQILWDVIEEEPGETVLGGIIPVDRLVVLNEKHRTLFEEKPGLERSTKGHEAGHWDLFVDQAALDHPSFFDGADSDIHVFRGSPLGDVSVMKFLLRSAEGQELLRRVRNRADEPEEARSVNRYAAAISMPRQLLIREVQDIDRTKWPELYQLKDRFDVTITALRVRLEQLNLLYVDDEGKLFESREQASGQMTLDFS